MQYLRRLSFSFRLNSLQTETSHITYQHFSLKPNDYLLQLPSHLTRLVFKVKTRTLDVRVNYKRKYKNGLLCPFCSEYDERFEHIFICSAGLRVPKQLKHFTLQSFSMAPSCREASKKLGYFLDKYNKYCQEVT